MGRPVKKPMIKISLENGSSMDFIKCYEIGKLIKQLNDIIPVQFIIKGDVSSIAKIIK